VKSKKKIKKISAILSTRNSERFISGCLDNLLKQTIADKIEIIVIDSASDENEQAIVSEYSNRYENIKYFRTSKKETLYTSWNRAIKMSSGKYIITTNTDDRSRRDAFEIMTRALDGNPEIALVYSDFYFTTKPNEKVGIKKMRKPHWKTYKAPDYSQKELLMRCYCGSRPMWRRSLHDRLGYFDESYALGGDYEFWLRITDSYPMLHIPEFLHLFYQGKGCLSVKKHDIMCIEHTKIRLNYLDIGSKKFIKNAQRLSKDNLKKFHSKNKRECFF